MIATRPARVSGAVSRQTRRLMIQSRILIQRGLKELQICRRFLVSMASTMPPSSKDRTRQVTSHVKSYIFSSLHFHEWSDHHHSQPCWTGPVLSAIKLTCSLSIPNILSICPTRLNYIHARCQFLTLCPTRFAPHPALSPIDKCGSQTKRSFPEVRWSLDHLTRWPKSGDQ